MTDFEVYLSQEGGNRLIGHARSNRARGKETVHFEYSDAWLQDAERFALEPFRLPCLVKTLHASRCLAAEEPQFKKILTMPFMGVIHLIDG